MPNSIETFVRGYDNYRVTLYRTCDYSQAKARTIKARRKLRTIERNIEKIDELFWQIIERVEHIESIE